MKLKIRSSEGYKFTFYLPISFLKSKFILRFISKEEDDNIKQIMPIIIKLLKKHKKDHGKFVFMEIESIDNDHIEIII